MTEWDICRTIFNIFFSSGYLHAVSFLKQQQQQKKRPINQTRILNTKINKIKIFEQQKKKRKEKTFRTFIYIHLFCLNRTCFYSSVKFYCFRTSEHVVMRIHQNFMNPKKGTMAACNLRN